MFDLTEYKKIGEMPENKIKGEKRMSTEAKIREIDAEIAQLENELSNVKGSATEVYSRIVGYYRAVGNWNKGKREEFKHRVCFDVESSEDKEIVAEEKITVTSDKKIEVSVAPTVISTEKLRYLLFSSDYCRNCQPVKDYLDGNYISYESVDVSTDLGMNAAKTWDVKATPTMIVLNHNDKVVCKANTREEVMKFFEGMKIAQ